MKLTDDLELFPRNNDAWIEIHSKPDDQFISVGYDEIDRLIEHLKLAKAGYEDSPDKWLKYAELMQIIDKEEHWSKTHTNEFMRSQEYVNGFLAGLLQAKYLITELTHLNEDDSFPISTP